MGVDIKSEDIGKSRRAGLLARFRRDRSGATAIEFAALAVPFSLLVFAILESCIAFAGQEVMANATDDVARLIRTGQMRKGEITTANLRDKICSRMEIMVAKGCPGLDIDLQNFSTFADAAKADFKIVNKKLVLMKNGAADNGGFKTDPGPSVSINMLRVFYKWPIMTDFMATYLANLEGGTTLHFATSTWMNEPFDDVVPPA